MKKHEIEAEFANKSTMPTERCDVEDFIINETVMQTQLTVSKLFGIAVDKKIEAIKQADKELANDAIIEILKATISEFEGVMKAVNGEMLLDTSEATPKITAIYDKIEGKLGDIITLLATHVEGLANKYMPETHIKAKRKATTNSINYEIEQILKTDLNAEEEFLQKVNEVIENYKNELEESKLTCIVTEDEDGEGIVVCFKNNDENEKTIDAQSIIDMANAYNNK